MRLFALFVFIWMTASASMTTGAGAQNNVPVLLPRNVYRVPMPLAGSDDNEAHDISGIACLPLAAGDAKRRCLLVNDEGRSMQFATIGENSLAADESPIPLIGDAPSGATLGATPDVETCRKRKPKFDELDGEGVAYEAPYFYVVGSHGCSRRKGRFELSAFILARVLVDASNVQVETTYRLADALARAPVVKDYFGQALDEESNGANIEGIAVNRSQLFAGLRAPSIDGKAFLVGIPTADLFKSGHAPLTADAAVSIVPLPLGKGAGIRDLAPLPDGRLLVLAGPAQEQSGVPYSLFAVEPREGGKVKQLGTLAPLPSDERKGKAEAVTIIGPNRVLVLFDSLPSGGPREYDVKLD